MMKLFFYRIFCGAFLGISTFAPGFSGSIVAITMGIYHDLVRIFSDPFREIQKSMPFIVPITIGIVLSGIVFVFSFDFLFRTYIRAIYLLFVGLIAGNLPVMAAELKKYKFRAIYLLGGFLAFAATLALSVLGLVANPGEASVVWYVSILILIASGFVTGSIALMPGMSISAILIVTGVYEQIIHYAREALSGNLMYLPLILLFLAFWILGLLLTSKRIRAMFRKAPGFSNTTVLGFMSGSMVGIFIQSLFLEDQNFNWGLGAIMLVAGLILSVLLVMLGRSMGKRNHEEE